ncbi:MAG TPA: AAA family ATPase, partial [Gammaproteobacteria bacterium]|nr:AAA family ATPase [Gammaproteobacteria bacterium]
MYEAFYNLGEKPFTLLPDPGFLYLSTRHRMALTMLEYGLMNQAGFTVISGDIGAGKTTLIRHLLNNMDREHTVGLISNTHRSFGELLQWILLAFNLEHRNMDKVEMYQRFVDFIIDEYAHNRRTVLIIDEAQNMEAETLEELRMLSNINADKDQALQVILVGQRELRETLRRPDLVQFAQRISVDYHLEPLSDTDTAGYIRHRLEVAGGSPDIFTPAACKAVFHFTNGVPRLINLLCDTALVYGYAEQKPRIDARLVADVAREKQQGGIFPVFEASEPLDLEETPEAVAEPQTASAVKQPDTASPAPGQSGAGRREDAIREELPAAGSAAQPRQQDADAGRRVAPEPQLTVGAKQPAARRPSGTAGPAVASDHDQPKKKLRIAICAAQANLGQYLARLLESYGFEVPQCISLMTSQVASLDAENFDLLLVDRPETGSPLSAQLAEIFAKWNGPLLYN